METPPARRRPTLRARLVLLRGTPPGQEVLLAHHRHPDRAFWCFPGGVVERGEGLADAAVRECAEETGLRVSVGGICYVLDRPDADAVDVFFLGAVDTGRMALGADPDRPDGTAPVLTDLRWVPLGDLRNLPVLPEGLARGLAGGELSRWGSLPLPE